MHLNHRKDPAPKARSFGIRDKRRFMEDLKEIRKEIDSIDEDLVKLLKRRLEIVEEVAAIKKETSAAVYDPGRERAILGKVSDIAGPGYEKDARLLFSTILAMSRTRQRSIMHGEPEIVKRIREVCETTPAHFPSRAVVACPGVEGGYAQQACSRLFTLPTILFFSGFDNVFDAVEKGLCPYGILPVENSAAGSVAAVYDLMDKHSFYIVKALRLKVNHVLLGVRGAKLENIKHVSSHPHALAQCSQFIKKHPAIKTEPDTNTALAAKKLAESGRMDGAVIASRACAELYGLEVLAENITDAAFNYTRFICIAKKPEIYPDAHKFSVMMSLSHQPGSLNGILSRFAAVGVNLTKLESRPVPGLDFEFRFTFDFEARARDESVLKLIAELADDPQIEHFTFLGAYEEA